METRVVRCHGNLSLEDLGPTRTLPAGGVVENGGGPACKTRAKIVQKSSKKGPTVLRMAVNRMFAPQGVCGLAARMPLGEVGGGQEALVALP
jgi:hypothetical protein